MPTILIVGASRGIGLALARRYAEGGWRVHATTRSGEIPVALVGSSGEVIVHALDVCDHDQIDRLKAEVGNQPIDVLIVSAGTYDRVGGPFGNGPPVPSEDVFAINTAAPMNVASAVFENLTLAPLGKMVFVSSAEGIRAGRQRPMGIYAQSKAALNDAVRAHSGQWAHYGVIGIALHPGWVSTDMGSARAPTTPDQCAAGIMAVVAALTPADCGIFVDFRGNLLPW